MYLFYLNSIVTGPLSVLYFLIKCVCGKMVLVAEMAVQNNPSINCKMLYDLSLSSCDQENQNYNKYKTRKIYTHAQYNNNKKKEHGTQMPPRQSGSRDAASMKIPRTCIIK